MREQTFGEQFMGVKVVLHGDANDQVIPGGGKVSQMHFSVI